MEVIDDRAKSDGLAIALTCLAAVMGLVMFWLTKTPLTACFSMVAIAALMIYPVMHFASTAWKRVGAFLIITVAICAFGWCIWPTTPKASTPLSARQQKSQSSEKSQPPEKTVKNEPPTIKTVYVPVKSAAPTAYIAPTNQPTTVNNAPNGIAISGGVVTSPTVNNYAPPPGVLSSVAEQIDSHPGVYRVKLHITVRNSWHDAAFVVKCDRPCHGEGMPQRLPNQYLAGSNWDDAEHPDWTVAKIDLPNPLPDGTEFIWWISSKDGKPISVNTIQRAEIVAQPPQR